MAGRKHFGDQIIDEVLRMKKEGVTNREISEIYGFKDKYVIKQLIARYNRKQRLIQAGVMPKKVGRPRKSELSSEAYKDNEIARLRRENDLLRSFHYQLKGWDPKQ